MNKTEYFQFAEKFFADCVEISKRKNADYTGGSADPFSNFTSVESLGIKTEHGFLTRMMDKMKRISSFVTNGELQVKDEAVTDTLRDLANYCCLLAGFIESGKVGAGLNNAVDITPLWAKYIDTKTDAKTIIRNDPFWVEVTQAHGKRWYNKFVGSRFRVVENPKFTDSGKWYKVLGVLNDNHIEDRHCKIVDGPHPENFRK